MAVLKCRMCGGDLDYVPGATVVECPFCGTAQTLPGSADEQRQNLLGRADRFRRQNEFDKAIAAYEKIMDMDDSDAEAHWGAVLARYGIEYVEDPASHERIPTCHRVQPTSILVDMDYQAALRCAPDEASRALYEREAARIAGIQKGILAISAREKPCDVFICYKETDAQGRRTPDSALAQDIYYQLTDKGYKVFFSRISLEDKLGREYEPYIFAALNSARVMLVVGTKPEYFEAAWVKNEWSRYLDLMKKDRSRLLIPCYRDMDPYALPEEMSMLQSQDMGRIGFIQDILHGIGKVVGGTGAQAGPGAVSQARSKAENLVKRAKVFMEDGDFASAGEYLDRALDSDAECAAAYLGKVQAAKKLRQESELASEDTPLEENADFGRAMRYADPEQHDLWQGYADAVQERIEQKRLAQLYERGEAMLRRARFDAEYISAAELFEAAGAHPGAAEKAALCRQRAQQARQRTLEQARAGRPQEQPKAQGPAQAPSQSGTQPAGAQNASQTEAPKKKGGKGIVALIALIAVAAAVHFGIIAPKQDQGKTTASQNTAADTIASTNTSQSTGTENVSLSQTGSQSSVAEVAQNLYARTAAGAGSGETLQEGALPGNINFIDFFDDGLAAFTTSDSDLYGFINENWEIVSQPQWEEIGWLGSEGGYRAVSKGGKWGYIDITGRVISSPQWDEVEDFHNDRAAVKKDGVWGVIDGEGNIISQPQWDDSPNFFSECASVNKDGRYWYLDRQGHAWESVGNYEEGVTSAQRDGKYALIDAQGNIVSDLQWDDATWLTEGRARVVKDGKYGYLDASGNVVIPLIYDLAGSWFSEGRAWVRQNGKYGYIDTSGRVVVPIEFDTADDFSEGLARVRKDGKYGFIDINGNVVIPFQFEEYVGAFQEGLASFEQDDRRGFIDTSGRVVISPAWDNAYNFVGGYSVVFSGDHQGIIDTSGRVVVKPEWDAVILKGNGYFAVRNDNDKWGILDARGNVVYPVEYDYTSVYDNGFVQLQSGDKTILVDPQGHVWDEISDLEFTEGLSPVRQGDKWGFIDAQGNIISQPQWDDKSPFEGGAASVKLGEKWGFIDASGNVVLQPEQDFAYNFQEGLAQARQNGRMGYVDLTGSMVISGDWGIGSEFRNGRALVITYRDEGCESHLIDRQGNPVN